MKATELRIGNLLTDEHWDHFKTVITVESINENGINLAVESSDDYPELQSHWIEPYYNFEQLRGIPLTEEWLLKFGFIKRDDIDGHFENQNCWVYLFQPNPNCHWIPTNSFFEVEIITKFNERFNLLREYQHVHQLQNLYFALTGEELTIAI